MKATGISLVVGVVLLAGCDNAGTAVPAPAPQRGVEVNTPRVNVKVDGEGTSVKTPRADVEVPKK